MPQGKDIAPEALSLTVELLKDHAFLAWVKKFTCFAAGTQVVVAHSTETNGPVQYRTVAIETLEVGDMVLAREEFGPALKPQRVEQTFQLRASHLRVLEFIDRSGRVQTIRTTDEHPFWICEQQAYVAAGEIEIGTSVIGPNEERQTLIASRREEHPDGIPVYNIRVAQFHTYFVGQSDDKLPLLVHNTDKCFGGTAAPNKVFPKDFATKSTKNWSGLFKSEGEARNLARTRLGKNPIEIEPGKWRSADGKWQFRAKPGDLADNHIHLEELDPATGEVLQNLHLRWPQGGGR